MRTAATLALLLGIAGCEAGGSSSCDVFGDAPPRVSWWKDAPRATCVPPGSPLLRHLRPQILDDCAAEAWLPGLCQPLPWGASVCEQTRSGGRLSAICRDDNDCPDGTTCFRGFDGQSDIGSCEVRCASDQDCVRCDLACAAPGVCLEPVPLPPPG